MAQPRQAPACRHRSAGGACGLAQGPTTGCRHSSRRHLGDHRDRRRSRDRDQFSAVDAAARLVYGAFDAADLRVLGRDLWRRRARISRRPVDVGVENSAADESLRLEQAPVRHGGREPCGTARQAAAAMGRTEILQRVRSQRVPQGHDDERAGAPLRRHQGRPRRAVVQVASRRHCRRRPAARLHLCRRCCAGDPLAVGDTVGLRPVQHRHRDGAQLQGSGAVGLRGARHDGEYRLCRHARGDPRQLPVLHPERGRSAARRRLQRRLHAARGRGRALRRGLSRPRRSFPLATRRNQMLDFDALSQEIAGRTVLCVGDLMLDEFVYGEVSRISPEAPTPVIAVQRTEIDVGGAGNVARNIASLGARCIFVGLIGADEAGKTLKAELAQEGLVESMLVCDPGRPTTRKVRFVSDHFSMHMLRADWEMASPAASDIEQQLIDVILPQLSRADIVLLSDYAKGVLTTRVIRNVIDAARRLGKRVIVDPKSANFAIYRGATLLTPNRKEFAEATRSKADSTESIADAAQDAMQLADCDAMLVTQSEQGMTLVPRSGEAIHVPAHPVRVRDVSGAGDTVAAVLAVALAAGADWEAALRMATAAAAVAVSKKGTATVTPAELRRKILPHAYLAAEEKIIATSGDLDAHLADWRKQDLRIGFTNGCFDILHPGHVKVLTAARGACDRLVVGLNSDASVKRLKGEGRPVQDERARSEVLAALEAVDLVVIFEEDTPIKLIAEIKPSGLVKGGDYTREQVVGYEIVEACGGEALLVDILQGHSTTSLVDRARGGKA